MTSVSLHWLHQAWCQTRAFDVLPQCTMTPTSVKVVTFIKEGVGMRLCETTVGGSVGGSVGGRVGGPVTFMVTNAMRNFVARLNELYTTTHLEIETDKKTVTFTIESVASALKYTFEQVHFGEEQVIEPSLEDVSVRVPRLEWKSLCFLSPSLGSLTLNCVAQKRACTLRHDGGRWSAAIQLHEKAPATLHFVGDAEAIRRLSIVFNTDVPFITLVFMKCGVLKWLDERGLSGYIAPVAGATQDEL
jgi:hypothetical protein